MVLAISCMLTLDERIEQRRGERRQVTIAGAVRARGAGRTAAEIIDLNVAGCRIRTSGRYAAEDVVLVSIPGLQPLAARVAWSEADQFGASFTPPLHPAVVDHLVGSHPPRAC